MALAVRSLIGVCIYVFVAEAATLLQLKIETLYRVELTGSWPWMASCLMMNVDLHRSCEAYLSHLGTATVHRAIFGRV